MPSLFFSSLPPLFLLWRPGSTPGHFRAEQWSGGCKLEDGRSGQDGRPDPG